jgi:nucleotide-binding universal stress UspA family protein
MGTIVVGYDGSEGAQRALERAMGLKGDGALAVVSVAKFDRLVSDPAPAASATPVSPIEREAAQHALEQARERLTGAGVEARLIEGHGDPADVIAFEAKELGADLIVVGTRGLNLAQRLLLGSVSTKLVHEAPCDVLVVR